MIRSKRSGWLLAGPHVAAAIMFVFVPLVGVVGLSLTRFDGLTQPSWVGLDNYRWLASNAEFRQNLWTTAQLSGWIVMLTVVVSVTISIATHRARRLQRFYRGVFLVPMLVTPIVSATVWRWMYRPDDGPIGTVLRPFGLRRVTWLHDAGTAIPAVAVVEVWMLSSFFILVLLAGLDKIPPELYEAAALDGAGPWAQVRFVSLPSLRPLVWFVVVQSTLVAIRMYDVAVGLSLGGRSAPVTTLAMQMDDEAFVSLRMGRGSAIGVALFVLSFAVTALQLGVATRERWLPARRISRARVAP